jgi:hypothetical protein
MSASLHRQTPSVAPEAQIPTSQVYSYQMRISAYHRLAAVL